VTALSIWLLAYSIAILHGSSMNRFAIACVTILTALVGSATAQEISSTRIFTEPAGVEFTVDGQRYTQATSFLWPKGSKHVVSISNAIAYRALSDGCKEAITTEEQTAFQYDPNCSTRYGFSGWETNVHAPVSATTHVITADPGVTYVKGSFSVFYKVNVALHSQPVVGATQSCNLNVSAPLGPRPAGAGPGIAIIGGGCFAYSGAAWLPGGDYSLQAIPYDGFIFRGWNREGMVGTAYLNSLKVTGPVTIQPVFEQAKRMHLYTSPAGLQLRIDRTIIPTIDPAAFVPKFPMPGYFDWARDSVHILGAVSPQVNEEDGKAYVFDSWSNGGGQDMVYKVGDDVNVLQELTARFVRGVTAAVQTAPVGLKVKVDGRDNFPYTFVWKVGSKVALSAPREQLDARGRKYSFKEWSNGASADQELRIDESQLDDGIRLTATYTALPQVVLQSSLPSVSIKVDGADCPSPCKVDRAAGSQAKVSVPSVIPQSDVVRYEFVGWSDGGTADRTVSFDQDSQTLVATYRKVNRLIAILDPDDAAVVRTEPASADGFYPVDASVRVTIEPKPGFRFRRWEGDLSGTFGSAVVRMSSSRIVRAMFDRIPYVSESGVRNAVGMTPETGVASGSLISIYGASLADRFEASTSNPLAQSLAGAVVFVEDRVLPLVYVSPEQINAQLTSDLPPGDYTLVVKPEGLAEVKTQFKVVRNAPGLFANDLDSVAYAVATHEDGTPVTLASPAKPDETITLAGTGFGPYDRRTVDGFSVAPKPAITLADPVEVRFSETTLRPVWAGAMPGFPGVAGVKLKLSGISPGRKELRVAVNGVESNTVVLPVE
jgi:uncharacterized protein (TIGR03437 family)